MRQRGESASKASQSRFNSRTPCGVRLDLTNVSYWTAEVSIHAPRAGCDCRLPRWRRYRACFNSRTPCGVRLGTLDRLSAEWIVSIHAPRAGCDLNPFERPGAKPCFNSRTPCGVRRNLTLRHLADTRGFNSRTPCGVRLISCTLRAIRLSVSIHAPRAGCDSRSAPSCGMSRSFNSRTPCGVRLLGNFWHQKTHLFQFTHPVRGATCSVERGKPLRQVSIHAPRAGCDSKYTALGNNIKEFQFTHPVRGATRNDDGRLPRSRSFNSRTPCGVRQYGAKLRIMARINKCNLR